MKSNIITTLVLSSLLLTTQVLANENINKASHAEQQQKTIQYSFFFEKEKYVKAPNHKDITFRIENKKFEFTDFKKRIFLNMVLNKKGYFPLTVYILKDKIITVNAKPEDVDYSDFSRKDKEDYSSIAIERIKNNTFKVTLPDMVQKGQIKDYVENVKLKPNQTLIVEKIVEGTKQIFYINISALD